MELKISMKNSKLGKMPNFSLPPGISCVEGTPCLKEGCYAMKSYRLYPNVKEAWDSNLHLYLQNPSQFFKDLDSWLKINTPLKFRAFVGGDFPDEVFYKLYNMVTGRHPGTKFLAFTKRYDFDYSTLTSNSQIVLSAWPGVEVPSNVWLPWAWLEEDDRKPEEYFRCPGKCDDCGYSCWDVLTKHTHVVFPKH